MAVAIRWPSRRNLADRRHIGSAYLNAGVVNGVPVAFEPAAEGDGGRSDAMVALMCTGQG